MAAPAGRLKNTTLETLYVTGKRLRGPKWFTGGWNPLEYANSFSYSIVLRAFNSAAESKFDTPDQLSGEFLEKNSIVLAASGGTAQWPNRYGTKDQLGDAFVESMAMKVTNGLNAGNGGRISPVTEFKLTVVETGGAEFIAAMMGGNAIVHKEADEDGITVVSESPFLVSIYYNIAESELERLSAVEKASYERSSVRHMKIRINKVQFSVKASGVTYDLIGTPYSHYALTDTVQAASYQQGYTLEGSTVDDYVQQMTKIFNETVAQTNKDNKGNSTGTPYVYEFKYHGDIAEEFKKATLSFEPGSNLNSLPISQVLDLVPPETDSANPTSDSHKQEKKQQSDLKDEQGNAGKKRTLVVDPATGVPQLLERLSLNSTFVSSYFSDKTNIPAEVPFIRVIPIISTPELTSIPGTNTVKKTITYNIVGIMLPVLRKATTNKTKEDDLKRHFDKVKKQTRRHYDYLFTGGNSSILSMDVRYDNMYVQAQVAWNKHHANVNTQATAAGTGGKAEGSTNAATTPANDQTQHRDKPADGKVPVTSQTLVTPKSNIEAGMPKDFKGSAEEFRALLPDIFNDTPEKAQQMIQLEIVGDPDLFTPVDSFNSQKDFEAVANDAFGPENSTILNPFEPYYIHVNIGNQASSKNSLRNIQFGGFYMPLTITHNWPKNGKYTNIIQASKVLGSDLKLMREEAAKDIADEKAADEDAKEAAAAALSTPTPATGAPSNNPLANAQGAVNKEPESLFGKIANSAKSFANSIVDGVKGVVKSIPLPGSPGSSPPEEIVTGPGQVATPEALPPNTTAPATKEAMVENVKKTHGGSLDANPNSSPTAVDIKTFLSKFTQYTDNLAKLSATTGDTSSQIAGEVNGMAAGVLDSAKGVMSKTFGGAPEAVSKVVGPAGIGASSVGGLVNSAKDVMSAGSSAAVAAIGGGATAGPGGGLTTGTSEVVKEFAKAGAVIKDAATLLASKLPKFQIPGMPEMATPTTADLTASLLAKGPPSTPIDINTGQLKLPDPPAVAGAVADIKANVAGLSSTLTSPAAKLTPALASAGTAALGGLKDVVAGAAEAAPAIAAPFSPADIKSSALKLGTALADKLKGISGLPGAVNPADMMADASKQLSGKITGAGLAAPTVGSLMGNAANLASKATGAISGALGGATAPGATSIPTSVGSALGALAGAGATALSGITSAVSKGLAGTSLSDAVTSGMKSPAGPLSGLTNVTKSLADKVKAYEFPNDAKLQSIAVSVKGDLSTALGKVEGELAKISQATISSTPGLSALSADERKSLAEKLSIGSLVTAGGIPNIVAGSIKPVGLNDIAPSFKMSVTGQWEKVPSPSMVADLKAGAEDVNKLLTNATGSLNSKLTDAGSKISSSLASAPGSFNTAAAGLASSIPKPPGG